MRDILEPIACLYSIVQSIRSIKQDINPAMSACLLYLVLSTLQYASIQSTKHKVGVRIELEQPTLTNNLDKKQRYDDHRSLDNAQDTKKATELTTTHRFHGPIR